jgi:hypothetical protein
MVAKSPDAFRTISEVAEDLGLPQHVLRFWETRFTQIRPLKRGGGRRFLLSGEGYTIRGVQRLLKEQGARFVVAAGRGEVAGAPGRPDEGPEADAGDEMAEVEPVAEERQEPTFVPRSRPPSSPAARPAQRHEPEFDVGREDHDPDDGADEMGGEGDLGSGSARQMAERLIGHRSAQAPQAGLSPDDAGRLRATLAELLELKRVLDQAR